MDVVLVLFCILSFSFLCSFVSDVIKVHGVCLLAIGCGDSHPWIHYPKDMKCCTPLLA